MIGTYVNAFKRMFDGTIEKVTSTKRVQNLIEEYSGITQVNSGVLAVEGIGYLSNQGQNSLLKFIEESKLPIVLLSYQDHVLSTIRSRMKIVVKHWYPIKRLDGVSASEGYKVLKEKEGQNPGMSVSQKFQYIADTSPDLYRIFMESGDPYGWYYTGKMADIISTDLSKVKG